MTNSGVTWLRPGARVGYSDGDALNDIHALLTSANGGTEREQLADVGMILARTGRPMVPVRHIDATVTEMPSGRSVARIDAEGATVTVRQEPAGSGLIVEIAGIGRDFAGADTTVTLDGRCLHQPCPSGGSVA